MIKIVIDENEKREVIAQAIESYRKEHGAGESIVIISPNEFKDIKDDKVIVIRQCDIETKVENIPDMLYGCVEIPEIKFAPEASHTEIFQGRTDKERREQDKWRRKFYKNKFGKTK